MLEQALTAMDWLDRNNKPEAIRQLVAYIKTVREYLREKGEWTAQAEDRYQTSVVAAGKEHR